MIKDIDGETKWTLADIKEITGYRTTITAYQALRNKGVHPVSYRKNPIQGGDVGEYDPHQVLGALSRRITMHQASLKSQK